jgi:hypothetical protein
VFAFFDPASLVTTSGYFRDLDRAEAWYYRHDR